MAKDRTLQNFEKAAARLRRVGLVPLRTQFDIAHYGGTKFTAPKGFEVNPAVRRAINRFKDVLEGTAGTVPAKAVKLTKTEARKRGYRVEGETLVVPKFPTEKLGVRNKSIERINTQGLPVRRLELPKVRTDTVEHFFEDLQDVNIDDLQKQFPGYLIGVRFFDNRTQLYSLAQIHFLISKVSEYQTVTAAHGRKQTAEVVRNFELILIPRGSIEQDAWNSARREQGSGPKRKYPSGASKRKRRKEK